MTDLIGVLIRADLLLTLSRRHESREWREFLQRHLRYKHVTSARVTGVKETSTSFLSL